MIQHPVIDTPTVKGRGMGFMTPPEGIEFEYLVQHFFEERGCAIFETPQSYDYGADLVLYYRGYILVIQCKCWSAPVGVKAVQEVAGAVPYYHANAGIVISNQSFTTQARRLALANQVMLIDGAALQHMLADVSGDIPLVDEFLDRICTAGDTATAPATSAVAVRAKPRQRLILRPISTR